MVSAIALFQSSTHRRIFLLHSGSISRKLIQSYSCLSVKDAGVSLQTSRLFRVTEKALSMPIKRQTSSVVDVDVIKPLYCGH
jgi:hypothetical protein